MAQELVERNGIGESANAVWKALPAKHQKLFPTASAPIDEAAALQLPVKMVLRDSEPGLYLSRN